MPPEGAVSFLLRCASLAIVLVAARDHDRDGARMIARIAAASLGLFAFSLTTLLGVLVQNPVAVVLSRALLALVLFTVLGLVIGGAAQIVVNERYRQREAELRSALGEEGSRSADGRESSLEVDDARAAANA